MFVKFFIITAAGILLLQSIVIYGVEHSITIIQIAHIFHINKSLAKVIKVNGAKILAVLVSMIWNYILYTTSVFKTEQKEASIEPY